MPVESPLRARSVAAGPMAVSRTTPTRMTDDQAIEASRSLPLEHRWLKPVMLEPAGELLAQGLDGFDVLVVLGQAAVPHGEPARADDDVPLAVAGQLRDAFDGAGHAVVVQEVAGGDGLVPHLRREADDGSVVQVGLPPGDAVGQRGFEVDRGLL